MFHQGRGGRGGGRHNGRDGASTAGAPSWTSGREYHAHQRDRGGDGYHKETRSHPRHAAASAAASTGRDAHASRRQQRREARQRAKADRVAAQAAWSSERRQRRRAREERRRPSRRLTAQQQDEAEKADRALSSPRGETKKKKKLTREAKRKAAAKAAPSTTAKVKATSKAKTATTAANVSPRASSSSPSQPPPQEELVEKKAKARLWGEAPAAAAGPTPDAPHSTLTQEEADDAAADTLLPIPPAVQEQTRRAVNRLAMENFAAVAHTLSQLFLTGTYSRHLVGRSILQEMERLAAADTAALQQSSTLPFAALLRGLQLQHGAQLGAELVAFWCQRMHRYIVGDYLVHRVHTAAATSHDGARDERRIDETAAANMLLVLAQLYLLSGVDAVLMVSLLEYLLQLASLIYKNALPATATATTDRTAEGHQQKRERERQQEEVAMCAAACGLELLRACGTKLLKEVPAQMESALRLARRQHAEYREREAQAQQQQQQQQENNNNNNNSVGRNIKSIRLETLLEVMSTIAAGKFQEGKRSRQEGETSITTVQQGLTRLLAGELDPTHGSSPAPSKSHTYHHYLRMVQSSNQLSGVYFCALLRAGKPPRWYALDVLLDWRENTNRNRYNAHTPALALQTSASPASQEHMRGLGDGEGEENSDDDDDDDDDTDAYELRQAEIKRMRLEESALAGQHFVSENKKEIFKLITHAGDDMECFSMLLYRDPHFHKFQDTAQVLLQCVRQEAQYNPFYGHVLQRFMSASAAAKQQHSGPPPHLNTSASSSLCTKITQFALWDCFKTIRMEAELDLVSAVNLVRLLCYFFEEQLFFLSVLRGLDLDAHTSSNQQHSHPHSGVGIYNKNINLFTRLLLLRMFLELSPARLTAFFFGGDGFQLNEKISLQDDSAHKKNNNKNGDAVHTTSFHDASAYKKVLALFIEHQFLNETQAKKWLPSFYEVMSFETPFDDHLFSANNNNNNNNNNKLHLVPAAPTPEERLQLFMKRVRVAHKALKQGIH